MTESHVHSEKKYGWTIVNVLFHARTDVEHANIADGMFLEPPTRIVVCLCEERIGRCHAPANTAS